MQTTSRIVISLTNCNFSKVFLCFDIILNWLIKKVSSIDYKIIVFSQQTFVGLQDVLKTSSTRLQHNNFTSSKTSWRRLAKTSWRRFQDLSQDVEDEKLLCWRRLEDVLKTCLEGVLKTYLEDEFKTSPREIKFLLVISVSNKSKCVQI